MSRHVNPTLCPPPNFAMVERGVYRSSYPSQSHINFIKHIGIRTIILLSIEMVPGTVIEALCNVKVPRSVGPQSDANWDPSHRTATNDANTHTSGSAHADGRTSNTWKKQSDVNVNPGSNNLSASNEKGGAKPSGGAAEREGINDSRVPSAQQKNAASQSLASDTSIRLVQVADLSSWLDLGWTTDEFCVSNVVEALDFALDQQHHPVLFTCPTGELQTSVVVGCMRKYQEWTLTAILSECEQFANLTRHVRPSVMRFIERWSSDEFPVSEADIVGRDMERRRQELHECHMRQKQKRRLVRAAANSQLGHGGDASERRALGLKGSMLDALRAENDHSNPRGTALNRDPISSSSSGSDDEAYDDKDGDERLRFIGSLNPLDTGFSRSFIPTADQLRQKLPAASGATTPTQSHFVSFQNSFADQKVLRQQMSASDLTILSRGIVGGYSIPGNTDANQLPATLPLSSSPLGANTSTPAITVQEIINRPFMWEARVQFAPWYVAVLERQRTRLDRSEQLRQQLKAKLRAASLLPQSGPTEKDSQSGKNDGQKSKNDEDGGADKKAKKAKEKKSKSAVDSVWNHLAPDERYALVRHPPMIDARSSFKNESIVEEDDD